MSSAAQFVPDYAVSINSTTVPTALSSSISSITFESGMNAASRVELQMANPGLEWLAGHINGLGFLPFPAGALPGPTPPLNFSAQGLFDLENSVALSLGYADGTLTEVFQGEITGVEAHMPTDGMPTFTLVAHDKLQRLSQGSYGRGFGPLPRSTPYGRACWPRCWCFRPGFHGGRRRLCLCRRAGSAGSAGCAGR